MSNEPQLLTLEAKEAIRAFVLKLIIPSGVALSLLAFTLGYFIKDVAATKANADALEYKRTEIEMHRAELAKALDGAKKAMDASSEAQHSAEQSAEQAQKTLSDLTNMEEQIRKSTVQLIPELVTQIATPKFRGEVLDKALVEIKTVQNRIGSVEDKVNKLNSSALKDGVRVRILTEYSNGKSLDVDTKNGEKVQIESNKSDDGSPIKGQRWILKQID